MVSVGSKLSKLGRNVEVLSFNSDLQESNNRLDAFGGKVGLVPASLVSCGT